MTARQNKTTVNLKKDLLKLSTQLVDDISLISINKLNKDIAVLLKKCNLFADKIDINQEIFIDKYILNNNNTRPKHLKYDPYVASFFALRTKVFDKG